MKDLIESALTEPQVLENIQGCVRDEHEQSFLMYVSHQGQVYMGKSLTQDEVRYAKVLRETEENTKQNGLFMSKKEIDGWSEFAQKELEMHIARFPYNPQVRKSGLMILSKWKKDMVTREAAETLSQTISGQVPRMYHSSMRGPTIYDVLQLKTLKISEYVDSPPTVIVRSTQTNDSDVHFVTIRQKVLIGAQNIECAVNALAASFVSRELNEIAEKYYTRRHGRLNLEEKTIEWQTQSL